MNAARPAAETSVTPRRRPRGSVRGGLIAAGVELARSGGPDAVVLREAARVVGVVPNAAYRHFADRDELLAAVCVAAMQELGERIAAEVAAVPGEHGDPDAALGRLGAIGTGYLRFARAEPGLFAAAFAVPHQHPYLPVADDSGRDRSPLGQLRAVLDEMVDAGTLDPRRREGIEFPVWSIVHGWAVLSGKGPLRALAATEREHVEELVFSFIARAL